MSNNIERTKLGAAFAGGPTDRSEGLSALLKPKRPTTAPQATENTETQPKTAEAATTAPKAAKRPTTPVVATRVQNVVAYLEPEVFEAVKIARRTGVPAGQPEKSYDQVLVEALAKVDAAALTAQFAPAPLADSGSLLPARVRRPRGTGGVQLNFRLDGAQRAQLERLAVDVGAPSRSALVDTALRLSLLGSTTRS